MPPIRATIRSSATSSAARAGVDCACRAHRIDDVLGFLDLEARPVVRISRCSRADTGIRCFRHVDPYRVDELVHSGIDPLSLRAMVLSLESPEFSPRSAASSTFASQTWLSHVSASSLKIGCFANRSSRSRSYRRRTRRRPGRTFGATSPSQRAGNSGAAHCGDPRRSPATAADGSWPDDPLTLGPDDAVRLESIDFTGRFGGILPHRELIPLSQRVT